MMPGPRARAEAWLDRLLARPRIQRLDAYLGISELRRFNPLLALIPIGLMALLGARTSQFGHIDTVGGVFPIFSLVSALNPFVGLVSAVSFGVADLAQKFVVDDVFYEGIKTPGDYWGARIGYLLGYSSLIVFGTLPGVLARVGARVGERVAARGASRSAALAQPAASVLRAGRAIGAAIGAATGGVVAAGFYQMAGALPFVVRPTPDHTCYALSRENVRAAIPLVMVAAGGGGASTAALPPPSDLGPGGSRAVPRVAGLPVETAGLAAPVPFSAVPDSGSSAWPFDPAALTSTTRAGAPAGQPPPVRTEGVVVSGPEAIIELINAGYTPVTYKDPVTGKETKHIKPTTTLRGPISGIGFDPDHLKTLPNGDKVLDPDKVAIVKNVPVLTGSTVTVQGKPAVEALINEGFPTHTQKNADGSTTTYVRYPPNLIHGNVSGIAVPPGATITVDGVEVINPSSPDLIVTRTGPPVPTAPPQPQPPQPQPKAVQPRQTQPKVASQQQQSPPQVPPLRPPAKVVLPQQPVAPTVPPQQPPPPRVPPQPPPQPKVAPQQPPPHKGAQLIKDAQDQLLNPKGGTLSVSGKDVRDGVNSWIKGEQGIAAKPGGGPSDTARPSSGEGLKQAFLGFADPRVDQVTFRPGREGQQVSINVKASMGERVGKLKEVWDDFGKTSLKDDLTKAFDALGSSDRTPLDARGVISIGANGQLQAQIDSVPDKGPLTDPSQATNLANEGLKVLNEQLDAQGLKVESLTVKDGKLSITTKPK